MATKKPFDKGAPVKTTPMKTTGSYSKGGKAKPKGK